MWGTYLRSNRIIKGSTELFFETMVTSSISYKTGVDVRDFFHRVVRKFQSFLEETAAWLSDGRLIKAVHSVEKATNDVLEGLEKLIRLLIKVVFYLYLFYEVVEGVFSTLVKLF